MVLFVGFAGSPPFLLGKIYTVTRGLADDDLLVLGVAIVRVQYWGSDSSHWPKLELR